MIDHNLSSLGLRSLLSNSDPSHRSEPLPFSNDLTAFCKADSKFLSIAITSPVAFIWVPKERSPSRNLSNGHLGILTTQ